MYRSIVVGTDGSSSAREAVERAIALAQAGTGSGSPPAELHVVSAYHPLSSQKVAHLRSALPDRFHSAVGEDMGSRGALDEARSLLDGSGLAFTLHGVRGGAAEAIAKVAAEVGADLIVVGAAGLGSTPRRKSGGVATVLAAEAAVDLLVVHLPDGAEAETRTSALSRLGEVASRFETDHPDLVRTISDVSYYLSGLGI